MKEIKLDTLANDIRRLLLPFVKQEHIELVQNMQQFDKGMCMHNGTKSQIRKLLYYALLPDLQLHVTLSNVFMLQLITTYQLSNYILVKITVPQLIKTTLKLTTLY